jgi:hypothetical protein
MNLSEPDPSINWEKEPENKLLDEMLRLMADLAQVILSPVTFLIQKKPQKL